MQSYSSTSAHIIKTLYPIIYKGVDMKDVQLINNALGMTIKEVENMKTETTNIKDR